MFLLGFCVHTLGSSKGIILGNLDPLKDILLGQGLCVHTSLGGVCILRHPLRAELVCTHPLKDNLAGHDDVCVVTHSVCVHTHSNNRKWQMAL